MTNPLEHVPLPDSVERLLESICSEQKQTPPSSQVRRELANIGEELAVDILKLISQAKVRSSLSGFIMHMIRSPKKAPSRSPNSTCGFTTRLINIQVNGAATPSPMEEYPGSASPSRAQGEAESSLSPQLVALGELEFRRAFLLLSYIGGESLERAISADKIRSLKTLPMQKFEEEIWGVVGRKYIFHSGERRLYNDWDSGKPFVYYCHISPDGSLRFKGPFLQEARTHLQKSLGDDNILIVKFAEESHGYKPNQTCVEEAYALYGKFGREGIRVGLRLYRFFVFKDGGKEEKKKDPTSSTVKCYFVRTESCALVDNCEPYILSGKSMFEARSLFMHAHTLPTLDKFMARFSLILSKTFTFDVDMGSVDVQTIDDVYCQDDNGELVYHNGKARIHTDGTGFISEDLAMLCPRNVSKGINMKPKNFRSNKVIRIYHVSQYLAQTYYSLFIKDNTTIACKNMESSASEPPLLIQCRLYHMGRTMKGTLLINKRLPTGTIQVRPSMIKVDTDPNIPMQSINSMEVVGTSNKPQRCYLNRNLIALLSYGGVPKEFFLGALERALENAHCVCTNKRAAFRVSLCHGEMDDEFNSTKMILSGIPLDEAYLQYRLSVLAKEEMNSLKRGKLYIPDCYYLMGTADPTGCLKKDQVCIILENGQISGDVLVYRNPGLHFGDIHILQATYVKELESFVGHSKYAIFFPCVGPRSLADEIGGGDFDGDMYWVSQNRQLYEHFKKSDPWIENPPCNDVIASKKPSTLAEDELQDGLFKLFLGCRFQPSYAMGLSADCWLAFMDRLLSAVENHEKERVKENMIKLIDLYYYALDAPKKGGKKVEVPQDLRAELYPHHMEKDNSYTSSSILGLIYDEVNKYQHEEDLSEKDITKLPCFDVEVPEDCLSMWKSHHEQYRGEMTASLNGGDSTAKNKAADEIYKKYKVKLYGASELEDSPKSMKRLYNEALAVYHVTYDYARITKSIGKCGFAWKVAGTILLQFYASKQDLSSVWREIFGW